MPGLHPVTPFRRYSVYDRKLSAGDLNRLATAVEELSSMQFSDDFDVKRVAGIPRVGIAKKPPRFVPTDPALSFWPRLVVHPGDPEADPPVLPKWYLHVRFGWRWAAGAAPEEMRPPDDPVTGLPVDEWEWEITDETHDGKGAYISFNLVSGAWAQVTDPGPPVVPAKPVYDYIPESLAGSPDSRVFVFGVVRWKAGDKNPTLEIREPGDAVVFWPSNDIPPDVGVGYAGTSHKYARGDHTHGYNPEVFGGSTSPLFSFGTIDDPDLVLGLKYAGTSSATIGWVATSRCVED